MNDLMSAIRFNSAKLFSSRAWWIVFGIVVLIQPFLGWLQATQIAVTGLHATPATHPELAVAIPPLEYIGFGLAPFGQIIIVVLGALMGASEYQDHEMRTTFLCLNHRSTVLLGKLLSFLAGGMVLSVISMIATMALTHVGLGDQGLHPIILSAITWRFIGYTSISWVLLMLLSFAIGLLFRHALAPILLIMPQVLGFGDWLANNWEWGRLLPVAAGNSMFVTPVETLPHTPFLGGMILLGWGLVFLGLGARRFTSNDVGGNH